MFRSRPIVEVAHPELRVVIILPDDRQDAGELTVFYGTPGGDPQVIFGPVPCLGRASRDAGIRNGNPDLDPLKPFGHTPVGLYEAEGWTRFAEPITGLGHGWMALEPVAGDAETAEGNGRTGIGIHAGRGEILKPTLGCIRLRDSDAPGFGSAINDALVRMAKAGVPPHKCRVEIRIDTDSTILDALQAAEDEDDDGTPGTLELDPPTEDIDSDAWTGRRAKRPPLQALWARLTRFWHAWRRFPS